MKILRLTLFLSLAWTVFLLYQAGLFFPHTPNP